jgi:predicted TPR repeat methyltransferase
MTRDPLASGDLIADRRYAYGKAAAEDGGWAAAAEMFAQAAEQAPNWAAAWFALGEAREKLKEAEGAADAFRAALAADPSDRQGAAARLALLGMGVTPDVLPQAYVARLFDDYAPRFDAHLISNLGYCGPALIAGALTRAAPGRRFGHALDLGCGTGLMGEAIRARADHLTGVDLSRAMIAKARERGLYDALDTAEATAFLLGSTPGAFDCILAADALCYFGDLAPVFAAVAHALARDGLMAFTVEAFEGDGFRLQTTMRFAHAREYVERSVRDAGFAPLLILPVSTRREAGVEAPGLVSVFEARD